MLERERENERDSECERETKNEWESDRGSVNCLCRCNWDCTVLPRRVAPNCRQSYFVCPKRQTSSQVWSSVGVAVHVSVGARAYSYACNQARAVSGTLTHTPTRALSAAA